MAEQSNFSTMVAEMLIKHDIDLARLDAGNAKQIQKLFSELSDEVVEKVRKFDPTAYLSRAFKNKKLRQIVASTNKDFDQAYEEIAEIVDADINELVEIESAEIAKAVNGVVNVDLVSDRLNANVLKRLADQTLIHGAPSREWWSGQKSDLQQAFKREMREGMVLNETMQDLVRRIRGRREHGFKDGLISYNSSASRRAQALARTSVMAVANAARFETYIQNSDVIKGVQWLSTLDTRTTDICKALDGQAWTLDGNRLPGTDHKWRGPPPAHWQCRSTLTPVLRSWSDMITDQKQREKMLEAEKEGNLIPGWRAAMDGKVSEDMKYEDWLKKQPESLQREILGARKHALWKEGKLEFRDLIDQSHQPFSLKELTDKLARQEVVAEIEPITIVAEPEPAPEPIQRPQPQNLNEFIDRGDEYVQELILEIGRLIREGEVTAESRSMRFRSEMLKALRKHRPMNKKVNVTSRGRAAEKVKDASLFYPDDWLASSDEAGKLYTRHSNGRGWAYTNDLDQPRQHGRRIFDPGDGQITTSDSLSVAIHELSHRLQSTVIGLDDFFQELHAIRTSGENLQRLRDLTNNAGYALDEISRPDKYRTPYQGREYVNSGALEVLAVAFQDILAGDAATLDWYFDNDREMLNLVVGLLFDFKP